MSGGFSPNITRENGFTFVRLLFAFAVFVAHFGILTGHEKPWQPILPAIGVSGFFVISGFLITRSYYRSRDLRDYIIKRIRRIVPAYMLVVIVCATLLSLLSSLPASEYFSNSAFFKYLAANISFLNFLQPTLPGVFTNNLLPTVDGSLWTIKVELCLYACVPIIALFTKKKPIYLFMALYLFSFLFVLYMNYLFKTTGNKLFETLSWQFIGQIQFFISGAILLFYFDWFKKRMRWTLPISIVILIANYLIQSQIVDFLYPLAFANVIIVFAFSFKRLSFIDKYGDFSYGFYLFHFPIIQVITYFRLFKESPILLFLLCFASTFLFAFLSWNLLEKRVLRSK